MPRIAAIDFGIKRIGLAISDEKKRIALPLSLVLAGKSLKQSADNVLFEFSKFGSGIEKILIGFPLLMNNTKGEMAELVQKFAIALESKTSIPLEFVDERLSSAQAERVLKEEVGLKRKQRKGLVDSAAAAVILQAYLDKHP